ncbi:MAG: terpene cyclase/mutase family protein, partial [Planctomycetes bacterium]|nr:terpene cyclase/mutase family protein [Planctomycetota bacterium]
MGKTRVFLAGLAILVLGISNAELFAQKTNIPLTDQSVEKAIAKGVEYLFSQQRPDGSWEPYKSPWAPPNDYYTDGPTAMAVYALVASDKNLAKDPRITKALEWMVKPENQNKATYCTTFRCLAWYTVNKYLDNKYMKQLSADVDFLLKYGPDGSFNYVAQYGGGDNSNSQYGLYGIWTGARAGMEIPKDYWDKCLKRWITAQNDDGGWGYSKLPNQTGENGPSYGSMTVAGIASLFVCLDWLYMDKFVKCQLSSEIAPVKKGLDWMDRNFPEIMKNMRGREYDSYFLYGVERVGLAAGYKYFGESDWYKAGAQFHLNTQQADGHWDNGNWAVPYTSYALLFLIRGRLPVLINRLEYDGDWNNRPRALANFCRWSEKAFETESNWQIITLKSDVNEWHDAP